MKPEEDISDQSPIYKLGMTTRSTNMLRTLGIYSVGDLLKKHPTYFYQIDGLGDKSIREIMLTMKENGFEDWVEQIQPNIKRHRTIEKPISLRDYFAGKALQGLLANPAMQEHILEQGGADSGWIEKAAYCWSDGMLRNRNI